MCSVSLSFSASLEKFKCSTIRLMRCNALALVISALLPSARCIVACIFDPNFCVSFPSVLASTIDPAGTVT